MSAEVITLRRPADAAAREWFSGAVRVQTYGSGSALVLQVEATRSLVTPSWYWRDATFSDLDMLRALPHLRGIKL